MSRPTLLRTALATVASVCALNGAIATPAAANPDGDPCFSRTSTARSAPTVTYNPTGGGLDGVLSFESSDYCGAELARANVTAFSSYTLVTYLEGRQISGWQRLEPTTRVHSTTFGSYVSGSWREARPILRACAEFNGDKICTDAA